MKFYTSLLILLLASCNAHTNSQSTTHTFYKVTRVVDGDTFWLNNGTEKGLKVRLIGIDAPESRTTGNKQIHPFGDAAKQYLKQKLSGKMVRLEYDVTRLDRYGRTLAYVYLEDGTFINADLVKDGYASILTIPPNVKYAALFLKLEREAREQRKGLWR